MESITSMTLEDRSFF